VVASNGSTCPRCGLRPIECQARIGRCSSCGQEITLCVEADHQRNVYCRARTAAIEPGSRGLVRAPGDAVVSMLEEAGIPYELHQTLLRGDDKNVRDPKRQHGHQPVAIYSEAWVPPEAVAIIQQANRSLADRKRALRKFSAWYARHPRQPRQQLATG
jgi:hypothetical protein